MLPGLRAVIAATIATVGLLMIAFGAVAAFRVAQGSHGSLQAELAARARTAELPPPERRPIRVIDTPGPHIAPLRPLPIVEVKDAPIASEFRDVPPPAPAVELANVAVPAPLPEPATPAPAVEAAALPPAEPPMGGPLAELKPVSEAERAAAKAERAKKLAAAKRARAARLARQRKAAARRAAQARAKQQQQQQQQQQAQQAATPFAAFGTPSFNWGSGNQ